MKALHGEFNLSHPLVAHFLSAGRDGVTNWASTRKRSAVLVALIRLTIASWLTKGFPLQFMLIKENNAAERRTVNASDALAAPEMDDDLTVLNPD